MFLWLLFLSFDNCLTHNILRDVDSPASQQLFCALSVLFDCIRPFIAVQNHLRWRFNKAIIDPLETIPNLYLTQNPSQVIDLIPPHWPVEAMTSFLVRSFRRMLHARHEGKIIKNLSTGQNLAVSLHQKECLWNCVFFLPWFMLLRFFHTIVGLAWWEVPSDVPFGFAFGFCFNHY